MVYPLVRDGSAVDLQGLEEIPPDAEIRAQLRWDPTIARATQHIHCAVVYTVCALVPSRCCVPVSVQASTGAWLAIAASNEAPDMLIRIGSASHQWPGLSHNVPEGGMHIGLLDVSDTPPPPPQEGAGRGCGIKAANMA